MKITIILWLALTASLPTHAEVFKCKGDGSKVSYQPAPCSDADDVRKIEIKQRSPEEEKQAEANLKAWQANHDAKELAEYKARQEEESRKLRISEVDALKRNADAQSQQKDALDRQARALEKQNNDRNRLIPLIDSDRSGK
ncbi:MAG: DUF4124 domain-containing protein [Methylobacter sp.]|jgi:hypothetical protein|nr:DUF4124 domain-containing protein [Methylobacter sp.]